MKKRIILIWGLIVNIFCELLEVGTKMSPFIESTEWPPRIRLNLSKNWRKSFAKYQLKSSVDPTTVDLINKSRTWHNARLAR